MSKRVEEEKKIPFSLEAEQAVLGGIFVDTMALESVSDIITSYEEFYDNKNRIIFSTFVELEHQHLKIDFATVCSLLESTTQNPDVWGGREYLLKIIDAYPSAANITEYAELVHNDFLKRRLLQASDNIRDFTENGSTAHAFIECVDYAEKQLNDLIRNRKTSSFSELSSVASNVIQKTKERMTNLGEVVGLDTGFTALDKVTQGFQPEQLIILAARPGGGKSTFALNVAKNVSERNRGHIAIFSLEMSSEMITTKLLANLSTIDSNKIKQGEITEKELDRLEMASERMNEMHIHFSDSSVVTMADIKTMCRKLNQTYGLSLIVIDYLQLIDTSSGDAKGQSRSRQEDVAGISRGLKQLARELKCPILALAQLSRNVEKRDDKKITMADLRESGAIEQDADIILFLSKKEDPQSQGSERLDYKVNLNVAKNREGTNDVDIELLFEPQFSKFSNVSNNEN